ncbi:MAG: AAA domain-containing protein [Clostridium sp.]|nr:AAA domain-containing protein [Clostridium sp.]
MENKMTEITSYLRSAVAAQVNKKIDFKKDNYFYFSFDELINGKINESIFKNLTKKSKKEKDSINVIIVAKTIKTIFDSQERKSSNFEDLTGIYYIPAILNKNGKLQYAEKKLPWIPREFLQPMIEDTLSMGNYEDYDNYISKSIGRIYKIRNWNDYIEFVKDIYENITNCKFLDNKLINTDSNNNQLHVKLEDNVYILNDSTVNVTEWILKLYDSIIDKNENSKLYENFINLNFHEQSDLKKNNIDAMNKHCGQMGGEYPLSPSQRECINHFTNMSNGEILAVNGPPGTGKTTLLQSIVSNMYVEKALKGEKPPLIVASSTNNQAVTNIIDSFEKIKVMGYGNLEERWIDGVHNFAVYFPTSKKMEKATNKGYHCTNMNGKSFVSDIEKTKENSRKKLLSKCSDYFNVNITDSNICEEKIHELLCQIEDIRKNILKLTNRFEVYNINGKTIKEFSEFLEQKCDFLKKSIKSNRSRVEAWRKHFKEMPILYKLLKFLNSYKSKIQTRNNLFIEPEETFLNKSMNIEEIEGKYSDLINKSRNKINDLRDTSSDINNYKNYLIRLDKLNIHIFNKKVEKNIIASLDKMNEKMDTTLRYIEFWLSVHYYECRWINHKYKLTENQRGKTFKDVLDILYTRLSMVTPCYVMTFYQIPKNFLSFDKSYLYNYIDLLIVDEAGQVSPEIAACSFALAKKAVIVGDTEQIKPIWNISRALDISLAIENGVISSKDNFKTLSDSGINASESSVIKAASKHCKYKKFKDDDMGGLFLSEHRRCYDEIICYCNELVYKGRLEPLRGKGTDDEKYKLDKIPQMGYKQIDTISSSKLGSSRYNKKEAIEIAKWINENFEMIKNAYTSENSKNLVGIITPFKAQVSCILNELGNQVPKYIKENIDVGTIHAFQGAERRIIIMSTVYGRNDGCHFIDADKSMLNVAVSRAKDSFLVFGDIRSLQGSNMDASNLLKKFIIKHKI